MIPPPKIEEIEGIMVVRDDLVEGGTKCRVIGELLTGGGSGLLDPERYEEFVYASPAYGYAQLALAYTCRDMGLKATIFTADRKEKYHLTQKAEGVGAKIVMVPMGFQSNIQAKAKAYAATNGAKLLPFGLDCPAMLNGLAKIARGLPVAPKEVWTVAGSGTLTRALQLAWPKAEFHAVRVGCKTSDIGRAKAWTAPEKFSQDAKRRPPFPSCSNYDAKAWQFIEKHAEPGALFWNVAA